MTPKERNKFQQHLQQHKRAALRGLWAQINKTLKQQPDTADIAKEVLFQAAFQQPYQQAKDYLLRNELRLLNEAVENFLVQCNPPPARFEQDFRLLQLFIERKQHALFQRQWQGMWKEATNRHQWSEAIRLGLLFIEWHQAQSEFLPEILNMLFDLSKTMYQMEHWVQHELRTQLNYFYYQFHQILRRYGGISPNDVPDTLEGTPPQDPTGAQIFTFWDLMVRFQTRQDKNVADRISLLEQIIETALSILPFRPQYAYFIPGMYANLGLEYFLQNEFEKAHQQYLQAFVYAEQCPSFNRLWDLRLNFLSNLNFWGKYEAVVHWGEKHRQDLDEIPQRTYHRIIYSLCMAYLMLGKWEIPLELMHLSDVYHRPDSDYYYARLIYAFIYCTSTEYDLAERELTNILQSKRYYSPENENHLLLARLTKRWVKLKLDEPYLSPATKEETLQDIAQRVHDYIQQTRYTNKRSLQWFWLAQQIDL